MHCQGSPPASAPQWPWTKETWRNGSSIPTNQHPGDHVVTRAHVDCTDSCGYALNLSHEEGARAPAIASVYLYKCFGDKSRMPSTASTSASTSVLVLGPVLRRDVHGTNDACLYHCTCFSLQATSDSRNWRQAMPSTASTTGTLSASTGTGTGNGTLVLAQVPALELLRHGCFTTCDACINSSV